MPAIQSTAEPARAPKPNKFFGPRLGIAYGRRELLESWRPYKVRPHPDQPLGVRFETGTPPYELWAGFVHYSTGEEVDRLLAELTRLE